MLFLEEHAKSRHAPAPACTCTCDILPKQQISPSSLTSNSVMPDASVPYNIEMLVLSSLNHVSVIAIILCSYSNSELIYLTLH